MRGAVGAWGPPVLHQCERRSAPAIRTQIGRGRGAIDPPPGPMSRIALRRLPGGSARRIANSAIPAREFGHQSEPVLTVPSQRGAAILVPRSGNIRLQAIEMRSVALRFTRTECLR